MIRHLDYVQVVLNDQHSVACVHQLAEYLNELVYVRRMQTGGGLVQDIDGLAGGALGQLRGQLYPLGFSAGQGGGRLSDLHIPKPHLLEGFQLPGDLGNGFKEFYSFVHRHFQHIVNGSALVVYLQGLPVVPPSLAYLAGHIYIRQKMHLDFQNAVSFACFAASPLEVEGESACIIATGLGILRSGEQLPDVREYPGVGGRIGTGSSADGGLVNVDDLVQMLQSGACPESARLQLCPVQFGCQMPVDDGIDQRGFPGAGYAGDAYKLAQGDLHVNVSQVMLCRPVKTQGFPVARPSAFRQGDPLCAAEVLPGDGVLACHNVLVGTGTDDLSTVDPGTGTDVHNVIRRPHGVLVMLHHDHRISQIPQPFQGGNQLVIVPLVQTDAGLVQNIQHPHQGGANLGGKPDPLAFAAGQCACCPGQGQIGQSHAAEESQPGIDLFDDQPGDHLLPIRQLQVLEKVNGLGHGVIT